MISSGTAGFSCTWDTYTFTQDMDEQCIESESDETESCSMNVTPRIDDITPPQGPISSSVGISIGGAGFGSSPSVTVGGTGITTSIQDHSGTSINVTLTVSVNATPGNHAITVTANGQTSNSDKNFFVQVPTKLRRDSVTGLHDEEAGGCGVTRTVQYTVMDQESEAAPIDTNGTLAEILSDYHGPDNTAPTANSGPLTHGARPDTVGYNIPSCPSAFTATYTQKFKVTVGGHDYNLSSQNAISMGRQSSGSKFVDITFTP